MATVQPAGVAGQTASPDQILMQLLQQQLSQDPNQQLMRQIGRGLVTGGQALARNTGPTLSAIGQGLAAGAGGFMDEGDDQLARQQKVAADLFSITEAKRKAQLDELFRRDQMADRRADNLRADLQLQMLGEHRTGQAAQNAEKIDMMRQRLDLMNDRLGLDRQRVDDQRTYNQGRLDLDTRRVDQADRRIDQADRRLAADLEWKQAQIGKIKQEAENWEPQYRRQNLELRYRELLEQMQKRMGIGDPESELYKTPEQRQQDLEQYRTEAAEIRSQLGLDQPAAESGVKAPAKAPLQGDQSVFKKGSAVQQAPQKQGKPPIEQATRTKQVNGRTFYKVGDKWYPQ